MKYKIFDMRKGLFSDDAIVEARSPIEAVKKAYPNADVKRIIHDNSEVNVVVNSCRGSYLYSVR
jgi:hypothetical protein